jgi:hypothetical protein
MAATTTREAARERLRKTFEATLDRLIPGDPGVSLKGTRFLDFENQADELKRALLPTFLEERAALDSHAVVAGPGLCPHCGSPRVYLEKTSRQVEVTSRDGPVVLSKQDCRCRACNGSFSPSGS